MEFVSINDPQILMGITDGNQHGIKDFVRQYVSTSLYIKQEKHDFSRIKQYYQFFQEDKDKIQGLCRIIEDRGKGLKKIMVYISTRRKLTSVMSQIKDVFDDLDIYVYHGDLTSIDRSNNLKNWHSAEDGILFTTNIITFDMKQCHHQSIICYDTTRHHEQHLYRILQASEDIYVINFVYEQEKQWITEIEKELQIKMEKFQKD